MNKCTAGTGLLAATFFLLLLPVHIHAGPPASGDADLTLFQGWGWVLDTRTVELKNGHNDIIFPGIARQLDPGSLQIGVDAEVISVRTRMEHHGWERIFGTLMGKQIRMFSETGQLVEGEVVDFTQGRLYLRKAEGGFTMIPNPHSYRLELDEVPETDKPGIQLDAAIRADRPGTYPVQIYYVANNIGWSLDYAIVLNESEDKAAVTGTAQIRNNSGTAFDQARVRLVAGDVRMSPQHAPHLREAAMGDALMARAEAMPEAEQYADHYVYELPRRLDLPERELYQFPLVAAAGVDVTKVYHHGIRPFSGSSRDPQRVSILYRFENEEEQGLGQPLPAGTVRVYRRTGTDNASASVIGAESGGNTGEGSGGMQLLGQDRISHIAEGDPFQVMTGRAFDVRVMETATHQEQLAQRTREEVREITARNEREKPVIVTLEVPLHRNLTVRQASLDPVTRTADRHVYELEVPAKGESTFVITLRQQN